RLLERLRHDLPFGETVLVEPGSAQNQKIVCPVRPIEKWWLSCPQTALPTDAKFGDSATRVGTGTPQVRPRRALHLACRYEFHDTAFRCARGLFLCDRESSLRRSYWPPLLSVAHQAPAYFPRVRIRILS